MTHDFRPGDVVHWDTGNNELTCRVISAGVPGSSISIDTGSGLFAVDPRSLKFVSHGPRDVLPEVTPTEHPSRARAASSLRAASASLTTAIDHLTRAGEAETYPGQTVIRIRTASEETQACIQHATMAMYWLLHERLS